MCEGERKEQEGKHRFLGGGGGLFLKGETSRVSPPLYEGSPGSRFTGYLVGPEIAVPKLTRRYI